VIDWSEGRLDAAQRAWVDARVPADALAAR